MPGLELTFREILRRLHASKRAEEIAALLVEHLAQALEAAGAVLQLFHSQGNAPFLTETWGWGEKFQEILAPASDQASLRPEHQQVVVIQQPALASLFPNSGDEWQAVATLVWLPLGGQEEWWGFLGLLFDRRQDFPPSVMDYLEDLSQQGTCALSKIWLIHKQKQEFDRLAQETERLTALGRLAAGVAHELNNPLASILLFSSNLLKKVPAHGPLHEGLSVIIQETKRCKALIQELLELARSKEPKRIVANLNAILNKVLQLLENEFRRRNVRLRPELDPHLPDLFVDIGQLQQVFVHLLLNALEAVSAKGEVALSSHWDQVQQAAVVTVADDGGGIPPEHLDRLFEPFFSTKPRSTGLGLTVSRGFIQDHGGDIQIESEPGRGTRVTVTIPAAAGPTLAPRSGF